VLDKIDKETGEIRDPNEGITVKQLTSKPAKSAIMDIIGNLNSEKD
jgi:hypothetical protein